MHETVDAMPVMDYETLPLPGFLVTAVSASNLTLVLGSSSGSVRVFLRRKSPQQLVDVTDTLNLPVLESAITSVSVDDQGTSFSYASENRVVIVGNCCFDFRGDGVELVGCQAIHNITVDRLFCPITEQKMCPKYSLDQMHRKIIVIGGNGSIQGDMLVLSQQGPPFPPVSTTRGISGAVDVTKPSLHASITSVRWTQNILAWSGPQIGVRIINTDTGNKVSHFDLKNDIQICLHCDKPVEGSDYVEERYYRRLLVLNGYDLIVALVDDFKATIVDRVKLDPTVFVGQKSGWWTEVIDSSNKLKIVGLGSFQEHDAVTMVSTRNGTVIHSVLDLSSGDIRFMDEIGTVSSRVDARNQPVIYEYCDGCGIVVVGSGISDDAWSSVTTATKRSVMDNCMWLLNRGLVDEAIKLSKVDGNAQTQEMIATTAVQVYVELKEFRKAASLVQTRVSELGHLPHSDWTRIIDLFISVESGNLLAEALTQLLRIVPFMQADGQLQNSEYDKIVNILVKNWSRSSIDLLSTIRKWPPNLYNQQNLKDQLMDIVPEDFVLESFEKDSFLPRGVVGFYDDIPALSETDKTISTVVKIAVLLTLCILYEQSEPVVHSDLLNILLRLRCLPEIFQYLASNTVAALDWFEINMQSLFHIDPVATSKFVASNFIIFAPDTMLSQLADRPFIQHIYLRELFSISPRSTFKWQDRQVALFLEFDPELLGNYLLDATEYSAPAALQLIERNAAGKNRRYTGQAHAILLWKIGRKKDALEELLQNVKDVKTAVAFVRSTSDPSLWELLNKVVFENEQELVCDYLKLVDNPESVISKLGQRGVKAPGILPIAQSTLEYMEMKSWLCRENLNLLQSDWKNSGRVLRFNPLHPNGITVTPDETRCEICGMLLSCAPLSMYSTVDVSKLHETYEEASPASRTALIVLSKSYGLVHASCSARTV